MCALVPSDLITIVAYFKGRYDYDSICYTIICIYMYIYHKDHKEQPACQILEKLDVDEKVPYHQHICRHHHHQHHL